MGKSRAREDGSGEPRAGHRSRRGGESGETSPLADFLSFRRMISPIVIQVFFWLGTVACVLSGLGTMLATRSYGGVSTHGVVTGLAIIVLGPLMIRIWCEVVIVFFRMNETLTDIRNGLKD
jgi:hypothetical protein